MKSGNYEIQYYANNKIVTEYLRFVNSDNTEIGVNLRDRGEDGIYNTQTKIAKKDCNLWFKVIREI